MGKPIVLGIDPGPTESGWAYVDCSGRRARFIGGGHDGTKLESLFASDVGLVCIEWPVWGPLPDTPAKRLWAMARGLVATGPVAGAVEALAKRDGYPVQRATAQDVRRAIYGRGRCTDAQVRAALSLQVDALESTNNHVRDAIAVAIVGHRIWERRR